MDRTITSKRLVELLCAELKLDMLEAGGVDNWEWYGEALNPEDELPYDEMCDNIAKEFD